MLNGLSRSRDIRINWVELARFSFNSEVINFYQFLTVRNTGHCKTSRSNFPQNIIKFVDVENNKDDLCELSWRFSGVKSYGD